MYESFTYITLLSITRRRSALFGHVARVGHSVPANRALVIAINVIKE